jgi:hypothetical protein
MPFDLKNSVALPARALTWIGSQGTRAVAALVFIGIAVPPLTSAHCAIICGGLAS